MAEPIDKFLDKTLDDVNEYGFKEEDVRYISEKPEISKQNYGGI